MVQSGPEGFRLQGLLIVSVHRCSLMPCPENPKGEGRPAEHSLTQSRRPSVGPNSLRDFPLCLLSTASCATAIKHESCAKASRELFSHHLSTR